MTAPQADPIHARASAALRQGHPQAALDLVTEALPQHPNDRALHDLRGRALKSLGRLAEAEEALRQAVALACAAFGPLYNLGNVLLAREKYADAAKAYRDAICIDANFPGAHNNLGQALQRLGKPQIPPSLSATSSAWHPPPPNCASTSPARSSSTAPGRRRKPSGPTPCASIPRTRTRWQVTRKPYASCAATARRSPPTRRFPVFNPPASRRKPNNSPAPISVSAVSKTRSASRGTSSDTTRAARRPCAPSAAHCASPATWRNQLPSWNRPLHLAPDDDWPRYQAAYTYLLADRFADGFAVYESRFSILRIPKPDNAPAGTENPSLAPC